MQTDVQFKYELRKRLTELNQKLDLLDHQEYEKLKAVLKQEIADIEASLQERGGHETNKYTGRKVSIDNSQC